MFVHRRETIHVQLLLFVDYFQVVGKPKERYAAGLPKDIIRINLALVRKFSNPDVFLKYLKSLDQRKHLKTA